MAFPARILTFFVAAISLAELKPGIAQSGNQVSPSQPWKQQICGDRHTCKVAKVTPAGRSAAGGTLTVVEVRLGLADKPKDGPDDGCKSENGKNDGGDEYWLVEGGKAQQLLKLCNDGYGASGIGEDEIQISNNRFTHTQSGGSNDRWSNSRTIQLSPPRTINFSSSGYQSTDPVSHNESHTDVATMTTRATASDKNGDVRGFGLPVAGMEKDVAFGIPLGDCAVQVGPGNLDEFLTFGKLDLQRKPELRLLSLSRSELLIQVYDPKPAPRASSWVASDHIEIWTTRYSQDSDLNARPNPEKVMQVGITLDGQVYPGFGQPAMPQVASAAVADEAGRKATLLYVHWLAEAAKDILGLGVVVVYSQADDGRQARLFATAPIQRNRPTYLPNIVEMPVACGVRNGRREVISQSADLTR